MVFPYLTFFFLIGILENLQGLSLRSFGQNRWRAEFPSAQYALPEIETFTSLITTAESDMSLLQAEFFRGLGSFSVPAAIAIAFYVAVQKQVKDTKDLIAANKESTEKQLAANKELIMSNKESTEKQLAANKELITAYKELITATIRASESNIENILRDFRDGLPKKSEWNDLLVYSSYVEIIIVIMYI